jgi:hypothetical protein
MHFCETNRIGLEAKTRVNLLMMNQMQHSADEKRIRFVWRENTITAFQVGGVQPAFRCADFNVIRTARGWIPFRHPALQTDMTVNNRCSANSAVDGGSGWF